MFKLEIKYKTSIKFKKQQQQNHMASSVVFYGHITAQGAVRVLVRLVIPEFKRGSVQVSFISLREKWNIVD